MDVEKITFHVTQKHPRVWREEREARYSQLKRVEIFPVNRLGIFGFGWSGSLERRLSESP